MDDEKKSNGAFVGLVVIIIILIIGGIYIWQEKIRELEQIKTNNTAALINAETLK
jgi:hypothetical protein